MKIIMLIYFTCCLFQLIKNTKLKLNKKEYLESWENTKEAYRKMLESYAPEYYDTINVIISIMIFLVEVVHIWLCTYLCIYTQNFGLKIMCYTEVALTIYICLTQWKEVKAELFNGEVNKLTYRRFEENFGVLLGYACYTTAIITLISR